MLTIEIHGVTNDLSYGQLVTRIIECMEHAPYAKDVLVSGMGDEVLSLDYQKKNFLFIWATDEKERDDAVKRLEPLDIDIKLPPLMRFIPKISTQEAARAMLMTLRPTAGSDPDFDYQRGVLKDKPDGEPPLFIPLRGGRRPTKFEDERELW